MKRIICSAIITAILLAAAAFSASAAYISYVLGDADGDSVITIRDVTAIQRVLAQLDADPKGNVKRRGNVTFGTFDINDATALQSYLAEFSTPYTIGRTYIYDEYELPFIPS